MRRLPVLLVTPALLMPTAARADWPLLPTEVVPIYPTTRVIESVTDGNGGACFLVVGSGDIRVLRLDASGDTPAGWPVDGLPLASWEAQSDQDIVTDGAGGVYVSWSRTTQAYLQRVAADGSIAPGWPSDGWNFSAGAGVTLEPDGAGGVYAVWYKNNFVYATRIQADGTPAPGWLANGKVVATTANLDRLTPAADGLGGCYFAQMLFESPTTFRTRVDHRDGTGVLTAAWLSDLYDGHAGRLLYAEPDGTGGVVVAWTRCLVNSNGPYETDQTRLLAGCIPAPGWPSGTSWLATADAWAHRLVVDPLGAIVTTWFTGTGTARASRRALDGTTSPGWPVDGVLLPGAYGAPAVIYYAMDVIPDGTGGILYSWLSAQVNAGRIDAGGSYAAGWPAGGLVLDSHTDGRVYLGLVADGMGGAIASWRISDIDDPLPSAAQHFNGDGTLGPNQSVAVDSRGLPPSLAVSFPRPNPAVTAVHVNVDLPQAARLSVSVFDAQGRLVRRLAAGADLVAGSHGFRWDLSDRSGARVRPGVYLIRAGAQGGAMARPVVVSE